MAEKTIILIRHALSSGQAPQAELAPEGREQAEALIERLKCLGIDGLFSSPYRRAHDTIKPYAAHSGLDVHVLDDLHERVLSPEPRDDWLRHVELSFDDVDYKLAGGESLRDTRRRGLKALGVMAAADHGLAAAVSHGVLLSSIFQGINKDFGFEDWRALRNPDIFEVALKDGVPTAFKHLG
jgi:2,3-bisphosphoglycerate-dependent phosphoglycerate mutase